MRFQNQKKTGVQTNFWLFNSLYEIRSWRFSTTSFTFASFNSLYEILLKIDTWRELSGLKIFQFSLWDSFRRRYRCSCNDILFQFPLWDSYSNVQHPRFSWSSFNSLYEIHSWNRSRGVFNGWLIFQFSLWDSVILRRWVCLILLRLSILFMRFTGPVF